MFCSPQPPAEKNGRKFPNKITLEQYLRAKELGFTTVYGHNEIVNTDTEKYAFEALELAEKAGLDYLVKDSIAEEYISLGNRGYGRFPCFRSAKNASSTKDLPNLWQGIRTIRPLRASPFSTNRAPILSRGSRGRKKYSIGYAR